MICNVQFQLKKDGSLRHNRYCTHPELIENYDLAVADTAAGYHWRRV